jgi:hypothetical protein
MTKTSIESQETRSQKHWSNRPRTITKETGRKSRKKTGKRGKGERKRREYEPKHNNTVRKK